MEGESVEQNNFEALLEKISIATSENHLAVGSGSALVPEQISNGFSSSPQAAYRGNDMSFYQDFTSFKSPNHGLESYGMHSSVSDPGASEQFVSRDNLYSHDAQSLALSFEQVRFNDGMGEVPNLRASVTSPNGLSRLNMLPSRFNSAEVAASQYPDSYNGLNLSNADINGYTPLMGRDELGGLHGMISLADARFNQLNVCEPKNQRAEVLLDHLERSRSVKPGVPNYQYHGGIPASAFQKYYMDGASPSYIPQQHLSHSYMKDEGYYRSSEHVCLQDHQSEVSRNRNCTSHIAATGNMGHSYYMAPQTLRGNRDTHWNDDPLNREYNQLDLLCNGLSRYYPRDFCVKNEYANRLNRSAKSSHRHQGFDTASNCISPESMLTRLYGVDTMRTLKSDSITSSGSRRYADSSVRAFSNGNGSHIQRNTSLDLDGQSSRNLSPDTYDFRHASKSTQLKFKSVDEVVGRISSLARDQEGCRFLQNRFTEGTSEDVERIFAEIINGIIELVTDPFGNYLVQKLLDVCNEDQMMQILQQITTMEGKLIEISCDMHGSRSVQKVIETCKTEEQFFMIASSLKSDALTLVKDINGTHVAQRCLQYLSPEYNKFLFEVVTDHCVELATHRHGCCVLQRCFYHADRDQKNMLMFEITTNALILSQDPFGNYVVQYILDQKIQRVTSSIVDKLQGNYGPLSMQKYSSNVVEKLLKLAGKDQLAKIVDELMNSPQFGKILQDQFGNYVIQSALKECKGSLRDVLVQAIRIYEPLLQHSHYGRRIIPNIYPKK